MKYSVVIVAAGSGTRMNLGYNKVYYRMQDNKTILEHTMDIFRNDEECTQIIVVTDPKAFMDEFSNRLTGQITVVQGGQTRQESVFNGVNAVINPIVMIHDGARPFLSYENLKALKDTMEIEKAAVLGVACKDTIKKVEDGYVKLTYDRTTLVAAQTPQVFQTDLLISCLQCANKDGFVGTDDCSVVEKYSDAKIKVVQGDYANIKITTIEDLKGE